MKTKPFCLLLLLMATFLFVGCVADNPALDPQKEIEQPVVVDPEIIAAIEAMGFKTDNIHVTDDAYWVEGDIVIPKEQLEEFMKEPETRHNYYGTSHVVSKNWLNSNGRNNTIRVGIYNYTNDSGWPWYTAMSRYNGVISAAIEDFNNINNFGIKFTKVSPGLNCDIQITYDINFPGELMLAANIPQGGAPGSIIRINAYDTPGFDYFNGTWSSMTTKEFRESLIHAICHCLGLAHSNSQYGVYSIGQEYSYQQESLPGEHNDNGSIMHPDNTYATGHPSLYGYLSNGDKDALNILYPKYKLSISGSTSVRAGENYTYTISDESGIVSLPSNSTITWNIMGGTRVSQSGKSAVVNFNSGAARYEVGATVKVGTDTYTVTPLAISLELLGGTIAPSTQTIIAGTRPALLTNTTSASGGTGSLTYQWQSRKSGTGWTDISNAKSATYQPQELTETTYFWRKVTDGNNVYAYSNQVTVTVATQVSGGTIAPESQTIVAGNVPAQLTSSAPASGGIGSPSYQWQSSTDGTNWSPINNATSITYQPTALTQTTYFLRQATIGSQTAESNTVVVNVEPPLDGGEIAPETQTIVRGTIPAQLTSSVDAFGGIGEITYQWLSSIDNTNWTSIDNATSTTYQPPALTETTYYSRLAITDTESAYSTTAVVNVEPPLDGGEIAPETQTIITGTTPAQLTSSEDAFGGTEQITYLWYSSINGTNWSPIHNAISTSYQPSALIETTYFRRQASTETQTAESNTVVVNVVPPLDGGTIAPETQLANHGAPPAQLTSTEDASGGVGTITYVWQSKTLFTSWTNIDYATSTSYQPSALAEQTYFRRQASSGNEIAYSNTVVVNIISFQDFIGGTIAPETQNIAHGTVPALLTSEAPASGRTGTITYEWETSDNGTLWYNISNASSPTYQPSALTETTYFRRRASVGNEIAYSNTVVVNVITGGTIGPEVQTVSYGHTPALLTSVEDPTGGIKYMYQWESSPNGKVWTDIPNAVYSTYQPSRILNTTYFRRKVKYGSVIVYSNTAVVYLR